MRPAETTTESFGCGSMGTERGVVDRAVIPELFLRNGMPYNGSRGLLLVVAEIRIINIDNVHRLS